MILFAYSEGPNQSTLSAYARNIFPWRDAYVALINETSAISLFSH